MSSATSTDNPTRSARLERARASRRGSAAPAPTGLQPWQFFLLAGMLSATVVVVVATGQSPAAIVALSLTIVAASFVGLGAYRSLLPLVTPESADRPALIGGRTRAALEREKTLVLRSIKELEFDRAMGKVSEGDFIEMSTRLRARALRLIRQLDAGGGYREVIERELAGRLAGLGPESAAALQPAPAAAAATLSTADGDDDRGDSATGACACGTTNDADARFCKSCGIRLARPA